jgi:hypothetical protein
MRLKLTFLFVTCSLLVFGQKFPIKNSALSDGSLFKIAVSKSGIYKLNKKNLDDLGITTASINPKEIKIYTNKGGSLPELIRQSNPDDLIEMPILVRGEDDNKFDVSDEIIFYSPGADSWSTSNESLKFIFNKNVYDNKHYLFLKISGSNGKRIIPETLTNATTKTISTNKVAEVYSEDKFNILSLKTAGHGSGKLWVGEYLPKNTVKDFSNIFKFKNLVATEPIIVDAKLIGRSDNLSTITVGIGNKNAIGYIAPVSLNSAANQYANEGEITDVYTGPAPKITLKHDGDDAWLDHMTVNYIEVLNNERGQTILNNESFSEPGFVKIKSQTNDASIIFDISDLDNIKGYDMKNGEAVVRAGNILKQFILLQNGQEFIPELVGKVANQNLHAQGKEDMLIVYHKSFKAAAEKLGAHRINYSKLSVKTILVDEIYNEFASGKADPTAIRNFAKMHHERNPNFKFLLLLGDGSYDYKSLTKGANNQNFIPVYETDESLHDIESFPSDDYYALLSDNEGINLQGAIDINVGRLTVKTETEANQVVDKIISYDTNPKRFGDWRISSNMVADDEDGALHARDADEIAENSFERDPIINQAKIYLDAFPQENTPGGERYPAVTETINSNFSKGILTWTYLGHGGPRGLSQERVVKLADVESWNNKNTPTLIITATCSFAGYDDPTIESGGELALLNPKGGAIALFTTVRSVYADENKRLTENVFENLYKKSNGFGLTFGEIMKLAKNKTVQDTTGTNTRKFTLLGDPAQRLAIPQHEISITKINGKDPATYTDTTSALESIILQGIVKDYTGKKLSNFSGSLSATLFDKKSKLTSLGNNGDSKITFEMYRNILYKGQANVINGEFTLQCIIPKDINYNIGNTRLSLYASSESEDAAGLNLKLIVGGSGKKDVAKEDKAPSMQLFMNDTAFRSGGITDAKPSIYIKLKDDLGINITGNSIGHDITAKVTGVNFKNEYILNDFYKVDPNDVQSGFVKFPLSSLQPGLYKVEAKAWDISNKSVEDDITFRVIDTEEDIVKGVYNYPNPFTDFTTLAFEHTFVDVDIEVTCKIYDLNGKLVSELNESRFSSGYRINGLQWNGSDKYGQNLANGMYLFQFTIAAPSLKQEVKSRFYKMVKQ